ncbi:MAG: hypothetical protein RLZZ63_323 [Gemmatimonadota bacterium]
MNGRSDRTIIVILPSLHVGGTERYALKFIQWCGSQSTHWVVVSPVLQTGDLHQAFVDAGCTVVYRRTGIGNPISAVTLGRWMRRLRPRAIVNFNGNFAGWTLWIARRVGVGTRVAWYRRSTNAFAPTLLKSAVNQWSNWLVRRHATHVWSNSAAAFQNLFAPSAPQDPRFRVIPNGIRRADCDAPFDQGQARRSLGFPPSVRLIGHVGRFDPSKNHQTIFEVVRQLKTTRTDFRFVFCGRGTETDSFRRQLIAHGIDDMVIIHGLTNQMSVLYRSLDLFYFPSITEGQPNALLEAVIAGIPIVASDIPPIREALPVSEQAHLVAPHDVAAAVRQIEMRLDAPRTEATRAAQAWAAHRYDPDTHFTTVRDVLYGS